MQTVIYFFAAFLLVAVSFLVFRVLVHRDYRRKGRLTPVTALLELLVWSLYLMFPYLYNPPQWVAFWSPTVPVSTAVRFIGVIAITVGLVSAFGTMFWFGLRRAFGMQVAGLIQSGPYRLTRNPQIVAGGPLVIGTAILWPSWYAVGWVLLYGVVAHLMVLTEEEHLRAVYGQEYVRYCAQVPRYLGLWRRR